MHGFELLNSMDFYVGFYGAHPFWVGNRIDVYDPEQAKRLRGIIPDVVVKLETERFKAAICVNGLMLLRVEHLAQSIPPIGDPTQFQQSALWMDEHLDYANAMQLCVESESIKCPASYEVLSTATRAKEICKVGMIGGAAVNVSFEHERSQAVVMHELSAWTATDAKSPSPLEVNGWRLPHEFIGIEAAQRALENFSIIARDGQQVRWLSYLVKAKTAYADNDYRMSFVLSWFVIESSVRWLWKTITSGKQKPPKAELTIAALCIEGVISEQTKLCLTRLRQLRNKLMHEPAETICQPDECKAAGQAVLDLALRNSNIALISCWRSGVQF